MIRCNGSFYPTKELVVIRYICEQMMREQLSGARKERIRAEGRKGLEQRMILKTRRCGTMYVRTL